MAKDIIHNAVKKALVKDGWTITADPYYIYYQEISVRADLAAERPLIDGAKAKRKVIIEVKSFLGPSLIHDFARALGQYQLYRRLMHYIAPDYEVWLAVSTNVYAEFFTKGGIQDVLQDEEVALLVVDTDKEEVAQWIS